MPVLGAQGAPRAAAGHHTAVESLQFTRSRTAAASPRELLLSTSSQHVEWRPNQNAHTFKHIQLTAMPLKNSSYSVFYAGH